jgi:aryl-alcohol dehydrogenase-like predicted oxidoreductase
MAIAFVRDRPFTTSVLIAASRADQLASNLQSLAVSLPKDLVKALDAVHDAQPNPK